VVTEVVETVTVPPDSATLPNEFAPAAEVVPTLVLSILFPAVPKTTLPFVAVIAPRVAVRVVPAVTEVPALTDPNVAAMLPAATVALPVVTERPVPAVTVVPAVTDPRVDVIFPVATVALPVVTVRPVPAVNVVPAARVVVVVKLPGAVIAAGRDAVATLPAVETVIWLAVPRTLSTAPDELPKRTQVALPAATDTN
jgi:hypothetical protein